MRVRTSLIEHLFITQTKSISRRCGCVLHMGMAFLFALLLMNVAVSSAAAQTTFGSVLGTVSDLPSGNAWGNRHVTNADISVSALPSPTVAGTISSSVCFRAITTLSLKKAGFQPSEARLDRGDRASLRTHRRGTSGRRGHPDDPRWEQAPIIETQPGALGQLVEGKQVQEMPLNGRKRLQLANPCSRRCSSRLHRRGNPLGNQAGGTFTNNTGFGNYQIGGGMANESAFYLDGSPLNTIYINSPAEQYTSN